MSFMDDLEIETGVTLTENGGLALSTTGDKLLNLFAVLGALRSRPADVVDKFKLAYRENADLTTKMVFYARDIRGGLGERTVGRFMLCNLAIMNPEVVIANMANIPEYGRWDDLFALVYTPVETEMIKFISEQLKKDVMGMHEGQNISLLAKWMPSINASSKNTVALAKKLCRDLGIKPADYRKTLSELRKYIDVTEVKMSAKEWGDINYEAVPSKAMNNYSSAFARNDYDRFVLYG